jgi:hypothetical protein
MVNFEDGAVKLWDINTVEGFPILNYKEHLQEVKVFAILVFVFVFVFVMHAFNTHAYKCTYLYAYI